MSSPLVTYTPTYAGGWQDFPNTATPIVAAALQAHETVIGALVTAVNFLGSRSGLQIMMEPGGGWGAGNRIATPGPVMWIGADTPPSGGTTAGGGGYVAGLDLLAAPA